jgi:hypothetical protein
MTDKAQKLIKMLDEFSIADIESLTRVELRELDNLLYHWQELTSYRLYKGSDKL